MKYDTPRKAVYSLLAILAGLCMALSACTPAVPQPVTTGSTAAVSATTTQAATTTTQAETTEAATVGTTATAAPLTTGAPATTTNAPPVPPVIPAEHKPVEAQEVEELPAPKPAPEAGDAAALDCTPGKLPYAPLPASQYYAYNQLTAAQKGVYKEMRAYAQDMQPGGYIKQECVNSDLLRAYEALLTDYPQFFWLSHSFVYSSDEEGKLVYFQLEHRRYGVDYICTKEEALKIAAQMKAKIAGIFSGISPALTEFERELYLHDWICDNAEYEDKAVTDANGHLYAFSSYGAFVGGRIVCEGYSRALQLLCYYAGIQCTLVTGNTLRLTGRPDYSAHHMWNIVRIDGIWGYTDATWNDEGLRLGGANQTSRRWFNIPEDELRYDHYIDNAFPLPSADSFDATWFAVKGQLLAEGQPADAFIRGLAAETAKEGGQYAEMLSAAPGAVNAQRLMWTLNTADSRAQISAGLEDPIGRLYIERRSARYCLVHW